MPDKNGPLRDPLGPFDGMVLDPGPNPCTRLGPSPFKGMARGRVHLRAWARAFLRGCARALVALSAWARAVFQCLTLGALLILGLGSPSPGMGSLRLGLGPSQA